MAIRSLQFVLCNPKGVPLSIHSDFNNALGTYAQSRRPADIMLDEASRQRIFDAMLRNRYSIRKCYAWVRVEKEAITKLPLERKRR